MKNAKLTALTLERFKSFKEPTRIELSPLTVILGRNNSGKSSIIQSLLLLKQTLGDSRSDVMLRLDGPMVEAFSLRELTYGWPTADKEAEGPTITVEWECPNLSDESTHKFSLALYTKDIDRIAVIDKIEIQELGISFKHENLFVQIYRDDAWLGGKHTGRIGELKFDYNIFSPAIIIQPNLRVEPSIVIDDSERLAIQYWFNFFDRPVQTLKKLLSEFRYLGSNRQSPPSLFKAATTLPNDIGINGELAAQLLHRRQHDAVHFLPPLEVAEDSAIRIPDNVCELPLVGAVNKVMQGLSINTPLRVKEIEQIGFQLMFGEASLLHVGRGLNSLLPVIELGLFADPLKFNGPFGDLSLSEYQEQCAGFSHIALEEPEAHLHPKVASRLAHWFVSLAMANRRLMVETHSDHLVRRLRGLAARAGSGSELERWLLENVVILSVEQDENGASTVTSSHLTAEGGVEEIWPADFMDEATDEESAIYYAKLDKAEQAEATPQAEALFDVDEGEEPELDDAP